MCADALIQLAPGAEVRTPFGRGVVRALRKGGRVLVDVQGRTIELEERAVHRITSRARTSDRASQASDRSGPQAKPAARDVDLHGLRVAEALELVDRALDRALQDDVAELRIIHGRSGGRLRAAVQRHLRVVGAVRRVVLDAANPGVTIVYL